MDLMLNVNEQCEIAARVPVTAKAIKGDAVAIPKKDTPGLVIRAGSKVAVTVFEVTGGATTTKIFLNVVDGTRRPVQFASADGSALGLVAGMPTNVPSQAAQSAPAAPSKPAPTTVPTTGASPEPPAGTPVSGPGSDPDHQLAGEQRGAQGKRQN